MNLIRTTTISFLIAIVLIFVLEILVRNFTEVIFLGTSKNLFDSVNHDRNVKNVTAITFDQIVYTNKYGHRVSKEKIKKGYNLEKKSILILGDSVAFGPGVKFEETFQGILESSFKEYNIINSSVIGNSVEDYKRILKEVLLKNLIKRNDDVFLLFCLNDVSTVSSTDIKNQKYKKNTFKPKNDYIYDLKTIDIINKLNVILRENSKLYLFIKGSLTNPSKRYFLYETQIYKNLQQDGINQILFPIKDIDNLLKSKGINFKLIILPYSYQLQNYDKDLRFPQKMLYEYFKNNNIPFIDATDHLMKQKVDKLDLFLKFDPMHFSSKGHVVLSEILIKFINNL